MRASSLRLGVRIAFAMLVVLASGVWSSLALALAPRPAGTIALSLLDGRQGPLVLVAGQGGWLGTFRIGNVGSEPLIVSRLAIRGDEDDVRSPPRVSARFFDGPPASAAIAPGAFKDVVVSWVPDKDPRMRQAFGHVVVTSTDEPSGEVAMGFRAELPTPLGWVGSHALSLLVMLPLLVPLVAIVARLSGRRDDPWVRHIAAGVAVADLLLALWACCRFAPDVARSDGNDGFQLIERAVWVRAIGAEWYLGVDGVNIALVLLAALLAVVAAVIGSPERRSDAYCATLGLLVSGCLGALVALDLLLLFAAWQLVLMAMAMLVGGWSGHRGEHAAAKAGVYGAIGSAAMLVLFIALSRASGQTFLVDGTAVAHTLSIPELARTSFASKEPLVGIPFVEVAWGLLFVVVAVASPIVPLHGWFADVLEEAPAGVAVLIAGVVVALGPYLFVRVGLGAMPEGARWAGSAIAAVGVLSVAYGSLCAMAQPNLRRFVAFASIASAGAGLFGLGSLTPQGIGGALSGAFAHGLGAALLVGTSAAVERRLRTC
ncbi:MAG: hypothetical protein M3O50_02190, partial [Myxococcota bacterium]|nr:hypothetical protein [Myxococcota bacterium]